MILAATIAAVSVPCNSQIVMASDTYQVGVSKGYLALRSAMAYDSSNEIGELYSGDTVEVTEYTTSDYWYVYSPKLNRSGYVNNDYLYFLSSQPTSSSGSYTVSVAKGYLALRSAKAYDSSNEIGQLYSGDTVTVSDSSDPQYWYVYSPKLNLSGYVNKDYLIGGNNHICHQNSQCCYRLSGSALCEGLRLFQRDRTVIFRRYSSACGYN